MKETTLIIKDQCNVRFTNLDPGTRRKLREQLKFFLPYAVHTPVYKMGRWDGYEYLFDFGGRTYIHLLDKILPILNDEGWNIILDDLRPAENFVFPTIDEFIFSDKTWPAGHKHEGEEIILMEHQVDALNNFFSETSCVQQLPTSSGKTLITAAMSYFTEKYGRSLVIVPNKSLVRQTEEDYKNLGLDVGVYFGDRKELDHTHTICTWQILNSLDKQKKEKKNLLLDRLLSDINCVIVDEVHGAKAKAMKKLLTGSLSHVPLRWGLTGTVPKDPYDYHTIIATVGPVISCIEPKQLQDKGILANCDIDVMQLNDPFEFNSYFEEYKFLVTDNERLKWLGTFIEEKSTKGNTLVLVVRVETGKKLSDNIPGSVFIHGGMNVEKRKEYYDEIAKVDNHIIIATYGVAAVGINIPRIFNLVLFEPGKSFIRVIQSIGRGLRRAKDKNHVTVYDITSNCKYAKKHLRDRKKHYDEMKYPYKIHKTNYRS